MGRWLQLLETGTNEPASDENQYFVPTEVLQHIDMGKFRRGQMFFQRNLFQCIIAMLTSLVAGLSVKNLLDVLVATEKSSTARTSFFRYLHTFHHLLKWHYGNVFDTASSAGVSIQKVREMHCSARKLMHSLDKAPSKLCADVFCCHGNMYVSQYDMAVVQSGFFGAVIMHPREMGINCSVAELDDYVYFWRWIGYLLGLRDKYNICIGGYQNAYDICKEIEQEIIIPALDNPPRHFNEMAQAFTDGLNLFAMVPLYSTPSVLGRGYDMINRKAPFKLSFKDKCRKAVLSLLVSAVFYVPVFSKLCNWSIEKAFACHRIT
ncbi:uncharacterized protein LOC128209419 [Mya arenaria]|nr:uncharacterized protein LOC128209419 [Mya arenaria]